MSESTESIRKDPRGYTRAESPRSRAKARAAELREHLGDDDGEDKFSINSNDIPDGWTYEWKRYSTLGKEDANNQITVARAGWDPVPADRHPALMPPGWTGKSIERDGMVLCERPTEIVDERRRLEHQKARQQVRDKEIQLGAAPDGQFERKGPRGEKLSRVKRSYEHVKVPNLSETVPIPD